MNTKVKIIIGAVGFLTLAITVYFLTRKSEDENTSSNENGENTNENEPPPSSSTTKNTPSITYGNWKPFGWVGGQNIEGKNMLGLHMYNGIGDLKKGDEVQVQVIEGDSTYNGFHKVAQIGADDGSHTETMITLDIPKNGIGAQGQASGEVRKVIRKLSADGSESVTQANTKNLMNNYWA